MGYLTFFINRIALGTDGYATMDFYNSEDHAGTSYVPFIGFMLFLIGLVVIIVGAATYFTATRNFNIFYDTRDVKITYDEQMMSDDEKAKPARHSAHPLRCIVKNFVAVKSAQNHCYDVLSTGDTYRLFCSV